MKNRPGRFRQPRAPRAFRWLPGLAGCALAACASSGGVPGDLRPSPHPVGPVPALPAIAEIDGPLRIDVVYPPDSAAVTSRDSTFIFGSTGSGRAALTINGAAVRVAPNGAFLAFLPVPADGIYRIHATKAAETASLEHAVLVPEPPTVPDSGATILRETIQPRGAVALPSGEPIEVRFLGTAGGQAAIRLPGGATIRLTERRLEGGSPDAANFRRLPAVSVTQGRGVSEYVGTVPADTWLAADSAVARPALGAEAAGSAVSPFAIGQDTVSERLAAERGLSVPRPAQGDTMARLMARAQESLEALLAFAQRHPAWLSVGTPIVTLVVNGDTAQAPVAANMRTLAASPIATPRVAVARPPADPTSDWTIRGRPGRSGPFHWFWPAGTLLELDGEWNGLYRVRLSRDLSAWVPAADVELLAEGSPLPRGSVAGVRLMPSDRWVDVRIALPLRMPHQIDVLGNTLRITVYGATSAVNFLQYGALDPLVQRVAWSQPADGVLAVDVELAQPVWGYRTFFDEVDGLVVRIRRPPLIDAARPLSGLLIAVDPGHPPGGATGPTRLTEAEANLAVAVRLKPMLEAAGARVLMLRTDASPVDLGARPRMAADFDADVLLSLHNNAFPDGVNPFENNGTSAYYYQPQSLDLVREVQRALLEALGLRDIGIGRADLALVRATWMPAVLSETMFLMVPEQENALRDPEVQARIAGAHVKALERFLSARVAGRR